LFGPRRRIDTIFANDYHLSETMTRHQSPYHGSPLFAIVPGRGVTALQVRLIFPAAHWLIYGESNEVKRFKTNIFHQMSTDGRGRTVQGISNRSH
jgi:hypothetical protein